MRDNKKNCREWLRITLLLLLPVFSFAQKISFEATTDAQRIAAGEYFEITFTLHNAQAEDFQAPNFKDFKVLQGPSKGMSTTIINGNRSSSITFSYTLLAIKVGQFTIGEAKIVAKGQTLTSKPITIEVVKGQATSPKASMQGDAANAKFFIKAEISTKETFVGSMLLLDYKLYTNANIENYEIVSEPDYLGFFAQEIKNFDGNFSRKTINGEQYVSKTLKRIALYPQMTGVLKIGQMSTNLGIVTGSGGNGFFMIPEVRVAQAHTEEIVVKVNPLPQKVPTSFSGGVGKYEITSNINTLNLTTDDVLTLHIIVEGVGDIKRIQAPKLQLPDSIEVYEPKILAEETTENNGEVICRKEFEYQILPKKEAKFTLTPSLTYFSTDSLRYVTTHATTYNISVLPGKGTKNNITNTNDDTETTTNSTKKGMPFLNFSMYWVLFFLLLSAFLGTLFYIKKVKKTKNGQNVQQNVQQNKHQREHIARQGLSLATKYMNENDVRKGYDEMAKTLQHYLSEKFNIPIAELSKNKIADTLSAKKVDSHTIQQIIAVFQNAELVLYAGKTGEQLAKDLEITKALITTLK